MDLMKKFLILNMAFLITALEKKLKCFSLRFNMNYVVVANTCKKIDKKQ